MRVLVKYFKDQPYPDMSSMAMAIENYINQNAKNAKSVQINTNIGKFHHVWVVIKFKK